MRNLSLIYNTITDLENENLIRIILDPINTNVLYVSTETDVFQVSLSDKSQRKVFSLVSAAKDKTKQILIKSRTIVGLEYLSLSNELCVTTADGEWILISVSTLKYEEAALSTAGVVSVAWSPDQEIVAAVTKDGMMFVMCSFEVINEEYLKESGFGDQEFITVGWGKKETQFHGTEGKAAAKQKPNTEELTKFEELDKTVKIVWRGDGEFFAISFVHESLGRMFKVFDKEGKLQFTSERSVGLDATISWRPSGPWIAIPQTFPNKYTIALFEKNGLRHREIVLPFMANEQSVKTLSWSADSEVLAIETVDNSTKTSNLYLYTICNYHWYQKQSLKFIDSPIRSYCWDSKYSEGKTLHILQANGKYIKYRWHFDVHHSVGQTAKNNGIVAVVDGKQLLLTDFRKAVIPPPMCSVQYTTTESQLINFVGFLRNPRDTTVENNKFFIVNSDGHLSTYNLIEESVKFLGTFKFNVPFEENIPLYMHHWLWLSDDFFVASRTIMECTSIFYLLSTHEGQISIENKLRLPGIIGRIEALSDRKIIVHMLCGTVFRLKHDNISIAFKELFKFNEFCEYVQVVASPPKHTVPQIFSLKYKQNLYINERQIAQDVTSMYLAEHFLAFTTLDQLKFISLKDMQIVNERRIERGGKIVVILPKSSRTVLQMPRGNLEALNPRVLSVYIVAEFLNDGMYQEAFDILRKQRINLNLLFDHSPEQFMKDIKLFIGSINNPHWLNLFITDLQNCDTTQTMYQYIYGKREPSLVNEVNYFQLDFYEHKIKLVCEQMITALTEIANPELLLPVITCHVKQKHLDKALKLIWDLKKKETAAAADTSTIETTATTTAAVTSQDALKYLLYLVDVNELYNVALGLYDFGLVLFVATKSQKDPKEYLPFLNELKKLDDSYRKYKIDCHLKRYVRAISHIVKCGEQRIDECLELIVRENLYTSAMELYKRATKTECYNRVVLSYAEHLREKGKFRDACLMYERGGDLKQAILSAKHILDWQKCMTLSKQLGYTEEELQQLVSSLVPALQESGVYNEAADLIMMYKHDVPLTIQILCQGKLYLNALYVARMHDESLIENQIQPHLIGYIEKLTTTLSEDFVLYLKQKTRLIAVRQEKAKRKLNNDDAYNDGDDNDLFSDTSSMNSSRFSQSSRGTGKTHRSSKNRRKHERKLLNLKEGNPFEDIALIDALYNLAHSSFNQQLLIRDICKAAIDLKLDTIGRKLAKTFKDLLVFILDSLDTIWIPEMITSGQVPSDGNVDYALFQDEQHYALIKLNQRFKPQLIVAEWDYEILK